MPPPGRFWILLRIGTATSTRFHRFGMSTQLKEYTEIEAAQPITVVNENSYNSSFPIGTRTYGTCGRSSRQTRTNGDCPRASPLRASLSPYQSRRCCCSPQLKISKSDGVSTSFRWIFLPALAGGGIVDRLRRPEDMLKGRRNRKRVRRDALLTIAAIDNLCVRESWEDSPVAM
jgi:hypothetical protein